MRRLQRYRARLNKPKPALDYLRNLPDRRPQTLGEQRAGSLLSTSGILRLQRTIGNQAVQRLIARDKHADEKAKEEAVPAVVASITFGKRGELAGSSHVAGHEGELSLTRSASFKQEREADKTKTGNSSTWSLRRRRTSRARLWRGRQ